MRVKANRSIKADFDAEAFRARHKGAQERSAQKKSDRQNKIINEIRESGDPIETAFELLVPSSGKADTVAGEMVRAMMRILYRDFNDGDVFYEGYGIETCGDAVAYLCDKIPELEKEFEDIAWRNMTDTNYTNAIKEISDSVLDYIYENPGLVIEKNTEDMFDFDGENFIRDREWEPSYDYDCDIPDSIYEHISKGDINERDLQWEIESWDTVDRAESVNVGRDSVSIYGLKRDDYDLIEEQFYNWLEDYARQLDDEYGDPYEDEEEYDEEDEE